MEIPKTEADMKNINAENRAMRIAGYVEAGLGYGEAQQIDDTAVHAMQEAYDRMESILKLNSKMLNFSPLAEIMLIITTVKLMEGSAKTTLALADAIMSNPRGEWK